jgi:hypothetical protein
MNRLKLFFKAKHFFLFGAAVLFFTLLGSTSVIAETYYPITESYNDVHWGYDDEPCGSTGDGNNQSEIIRVYFPDIGNDDKNVISAKLYITAFYNAVSLSNADIELQQTYGLCDTSLFNKVYSVNPEQYLPNATEVEINVPLSKFDCDNDWSRSYNHAFLYYKTNVFNQYVQLADARLEITFGGNCTSDSEDAEEESSGDTEEENSENTAALVPIYSLILF